jgi:serine/threonine protein kinase
VRGHVEHLPKICERCGARYDASAAFCTRDGTPLDVGAAPDAYLGQTLLGQFHIEARLGAGGMGTVYRARQLGVERPVAVKILHAELTQNADAIRRFQREARVSAALDHPNIVRVILFGQLPDNSLFLVMEFLDGRSLADVLHAEGALAPPRAVHITLQICDAIGEAHREGVVHRDVKPENIQLVTRGRDADFVKVLDFGIARFLWGEQTMVTQTGLIFGTARYISPEGAAGEVTDARSDVYSIGVLLFQLLCGETPFDAPAPVSLLMKHIQDPAPDVRARGRGAGVPAPIAEVVARTLAKNPDARFDDARALADALRDAALRAGLTSASPQPGPSLAPPASLTGAPFAQRPVDARGSAPPIEAHGTLPRRNTTSGEPFATTYDAAASFGDERSVDEAAEAAGLTPQRRRTRKRLLFAAFLTGALAVGVGAFVAKRLGGTESAAPDRDALARRARAAFDVGAYDEHSPHRTAPGEDILTLTRAILLAHPGDADALRLREAAARRLVADADQARGALRWDDARALYDRALRLAPDEQSAREGLAIVAQHEHAAAATAGVRTVPAVPRAGEAVTLVATLAQGTTLPAGAIPRFRVTRGGRALRGEIRATLGDDGAWLGGFTFPQAGEYGVFFTVDDATAGLQLRAQILVDASDAPRAASRRRTPRDNDTPMVLTHEVREPAPPNVVVPPRPEDGIDWRIPPEPPPARRPDTPNSDTPTPPSPPAPPAPWTGQTL